MTTVKIRKKLIEVALPLEAINIASVREKSVRHGHPSTLHLYWARRPLAAARAVIFAQMVDDPSANPELFPTVKLQDKERQRLFAIIEDLVIWENTTNEKVLQAARDEIWASWRRACADNADHPRAKDIFNRNKLPAFHDPFAGGGALPLEAQRLGLESYASDLNPIAVVINKAMIEIPPRFAGLKPVNPEVRTTRSLIDQDWSGAQGLADDVRYYGKWLRDEAEKRIGHLYPSVDVTLEMTSDRPDLKPYVGQKLKVVAWIWTRTVKSPNPAFSDIDVPLATTFLLGGKIGKEAYVEPIIRDKMYQFRVKVGKPPNLEAVSSGTKIARGSFRCLLSGVPIGYEYIDSEAAAGRMKERLMAVVAEGAKGRVWLSPTVEAESIARSACPTFKPDLPTWGTGGSNAIGRRYGFQIFGDYFTPRQLVALTTLSDLVQEARIKVENDAIIAGVRDDKLTLDEGGGGVTAYAESVAVYLAFLVDQVANHSASVCGWNSANTQMRSVFARQVIPMTWDFAESNPFGDSSGSYNNLFERQLKAFISLGGGVPGKSTCADASSQEISVDCLVSTDPPYYDNIAYADLSDFFYVWLRRSLRNIFPSLFSTLSTPKADELVALPYRHGGKDAAATYFLNGMTRAMYRLSKQAHPGFPVTIYYAFKQSETQTDGTASTGWDTFLDAVIKAGFEISGTWPISTEKEGRVVSFEKSALASSIVLVCRSRGVDSTAVSRREFVTALKSELNIALAYLQRGNIAPVDLAQAAIGPGIAIFTRYTKVVGADGAAMSVREALQLINQILDEQLSEQEGNWDADTRWGVVWFDQNAFSKGEFGQADQLARAKNTSVFGVVEAGFVESSAGKVRLLKPEEMSVNWAPETDNRLTVWEMLHHLIRLQKQGEAQAAAMLARLGDKADAAKELAYRLYGICEKKKRSTEGQLYNDLIVVWPDLVNQSKQAPAPTTRPGEFELDA